MERLKLYFNEPLVEMRFSERILVRIISNISFTVFIIATFAFLMSASGPLVWLGILMFLVLLDKAVHAGKPKRYLLHLPQHGEVNIADYIAPRVREMLIHAHERWFLRENNFFLELVLSGLRDKEVREAMLRLDAKLDEFEDKLLSYIKESKEQDSHETVTDAMGALLADAMNIANKNGADFIGTGDLFAALARCDDVETRKLFALFQIDTEDLERALIFGRFKRFHLFDSIPRAIGGFASRRQRGRVINRAWTSRPTPTLDLYASDYTELAKSGRIGFLIGHSEEYERLLNILSRRVRPNALLVGEPGIGKGSLVAHLAYMISKDKVPQELFDKRLIGLDTGSLIAGASESEIQARVQKIFAEVYEAGNIVLYIPEVHNLAKSSAGSQNNILNSILPMILENNFPLIATSFPKEYKQYIESSSSAAQAFEVIRVNELTVDEATRVLIYQAFFLEREYKISVSYGAVKKSVEIAKKYFASHPLPGSAASLLKEGIAYAVRHGGKILTAEDVIAVAESRINIPIKRAGEGEAEKLLNLEKIIHERLVDQEPAVQAVAEALRQYRSGLSRQGGPIGTFLFVGPTGVGKTELSKILAKLQFGSEENMIRFDMSEYQDKQSIFQFIGSPDGKMTGLLTDQVLEKPYSLILLDEFEKAHPDLLNMFLGVFDDGRLTDNLGRVVSFENTIIIATSNAHSNLIKEQLEAGKNISDISAEIKKKLTGFFKPELLNRFSSIVVFRDLSRADIELIAERQLKSLRETLAEGQSIELIITPAAVKRIAELGFDPVFGARPLREAISKNIKDPLSKLILGQKVLRGGKITADIEGNEIVMKAS